MTENKDWEILLIKAPSGHLFQPNPKYDIYNQTIEPNAIYSVKRLTDGLVVQVGDLADILPRHYNPIWAFFIAGEAVYVVGKNFIFVCNLMQLKGKLEVPSPNSLNELKLRGVENAIHRYRAQGRPVPPELEQRRKELFQSIKNNPLPTQFKFDKAVEKCDCSGEEHDQKCQNAPKENEFLPVSLSLPKELLEFIDHLEHLKKECYKMASIAFGIGEEYFGADEQKK